MDFASTASVDLTFHSSFRRSLLRHCGLRRWWRCTQPADTTVSCSCWNTIHHSLRDSEFSGLFDNKVLLDKLKVLLDKLKPEFISGLDRDTRFEILDESSCSSSDDDDDDDDGSDSRAGSSSFSSSFSSSSPYRGPSPK
jgi:hypothetical protein